jgi:hypothetical protein
MKPLIKILLLILVVSQTFFVFAGNYKLEDSAELLNGGDSVLVLDVLEQMSMEYSSNIYVYLLSGIGNEKQAILVKQLWQDNNPGKSDVIIIYFLDVEKVIISNSVDGEFSAEDMGHVGSLLENSFAKGDYYNGLSDSITYLKEKLSEKKSEGLLINQKGISIYKMNPWTLGYDHYFTKDGILTDYYIDGAPERDKKRFVTFTVREKRTFWNSAVAEFSKVSDNEGYKVSKKLKRFPEWMDGLEISYDYGKKVYSLYEAKSIEVKLGEVTVTKEGLMRHILQYKGTDTGYRIIYSNVKRFSSEEKRLSLHKVSDSSSDGIIISELAKVGGGNTYTFNVTNFSENKIPVWLEGFAFEYDPSDDTLEIVEDKN